MSQPIGHLASEVSCGDGRESINTRRSGNSAGGGCGCGCGCGIRAGAGGGRGGGGGGGGGRWQVAGGRW